MLSENEEVISFYPGNSKNGQVSLGRIVVHDRLTVESDVLPRYFNHSSFASLRRQLNYFSFTRMGKGRQRGATYCNDAVIDMNDILRLKRRSSVGGQNAPDSSQVSLLSSRRGVEATSSKRSNNSGPAQSSSSSLKDGYEVQSEVPAKKARYTNNHPTLVSPRTSPVHDSTSSDKEPRIILDLTVPLSTTTTSSSPVRHDRFSLSSFAQHTSPARSCHSIFNNHRNGEDDILAGCNALLSFSKGFSHCTVGGIGSAF
jgi:hypothetical protein